MASNSDKYADKLTRLDAVLLKMDTMSGQKSSAVVNIAALLKHQDKIKEAMGEDVDFGDFFAVLANRVMNGGAIVLTDEATTGHVVEVEFSKKVRF